MTTHSFLSEAVVILSGLDEISIMDSLQEEGALMPEGTTVAGVSIIGFTLRVFTRRTNTGVFGDFGDETKRY